MIPDQIAVREAAAGFDATDGLRDERAAKGLRMVLARLVEVAAIRVRGKGIWNIRATV